APVPGKNKKLNNVGTLLHNIVQQPALATGWHAPEQVWRAGEWTNDWEEQNSSVASLSLKKYVSASWGNKLVIRHHSAGHFQLEESETTARIKYGIHLHTIFSRIRYKDDLNETFQMLQQSGIMNEQEKPVIRQLVDELFANETVASWFDKAWEVRTEVPVLLPGGEESRMDRLMLKGRQAVVVDFKTGTPTNADLHQVNGYLDTLRKMNFHPVKGYLLYIRTGEVVQVPPDKPAKSAKQNKNQLGLEF
ncbi:MAG TPA: PD-(D/E)XK nuclease family protein, partial [Cyclobacteriaceae bacterium]|nr:PD-(D/E)XK nuclease family protein [Cyclobacteriaceae bacterium]